jgi:peptide/nickel transport system permease protein
MALVPGSSAGELLGVPDPELGDAGVPYRSRGGVLSAFLSNKLGVLGLALIVLVVLFCFVGPVIYSTNQVHTSLATANLHPGAGHPLGTDAVGYNELGRIMVGGQSSIEIGFVAALLAGVIGVLWGAISGYFGGIVDAIMMRIVDALLSLPVLFVLLLLGSIVTPNAFNLTIIVALFAWLVPARLIRGETLILRNREYVQAVRGMGGGARRSVFLHVIPNAIGTIVVNITFQIADAVLLLAALGYLGFGIPAPAANWGEMLSQGISFLYAGEWWLIYPVGIMIILTVLAFNIVGDALRDAFDGRLQRR